MPMMPLADEAQALSGWVQRPPCWEVESGEISPPLEGLWPIPESSVLRAPIVTPSHPVSPCLSLPKVGLLGPGTQAGCDVLGEDRSFLPSPEWGHLACGNLRLQMLEPELQGLEMEPCVPCILQMRQPGPREGV
jgi:hypothetical protein